MIEIKITLPTVDDAMEVIQKLAGVNLKVEAANIGDAEIVAKPKKETPKAKADKATKAAYDEAPKGKAKTKAAQEITLEVVKERVLELIGDDADGPDRIKEFVRGFGVSKLSDMTAKQLKQAYDTAEEFFNGKSEDEEIEEDPMA